MRGVPYIAVLCVCTLAHTNTTTSLSLSPTPVGGGVLYQCAYSVPALSSISIDGTLITSYLIGLFILCIHDNNTCTVSKAAKVDLWLGGSEG